MKRLTEGRLPEDVMLLSTRDTRRALRILAALSGETMKQVLTRLISAEVKRVAAVKS